MKFSAPLCSSRLRLISPLWASHFGLLSGWAYYPGEFYVMLVNKMSRETGLIKQLGLLSGDLLTYVYFVSLFPCVLVELTGMGLGTMGLMGFLCQSILCNTSW